MRALVLDFDGVISDSAREAFCVALRVWCVLVPASPLRDTLDLLVGVPPDAHPLYPRFLEIMPLGNRAEDYAVALAAIEGDVPLDDQAGYDAFKAGLEPARLRAFHERFYRFRGAWSRADREGWLRLMAPYPPIVDLLRRRAGEVELAIATSKDRRSVRELLASYGIDDLFPEGRVLDKESGVTKRIHLEHLSRAERWPLASITFVDDKVNHLEPVGELGVRCVLAAWGYNGGREHARARELGFLVCDLDDVEGVLFR